MGSVVKSIGKVFKKAGKALKKIAPVLLVAAAAYVGYGYATGWEGAGWPRITEWGKNLMSGVRTGNSLSQSAVNASEMSFNGASATAPTYSAETFPVSGPGSVAGTPLDVTTTINEAVPANGLLGNSPVSSQVIPGSAQQIEAMLDGKQLDPSMLDASASTRGSYIVDALLREDTGTQPPQSPLLDTNASASASRLAGGGADKLAVDAFKPDLTNKSWWDMTLGEKSGEAWNIYKQLWKDDPMIAVYGTNKVLQLVLSLLAEEEEDRSNRAMGFDPNISYADLAKRGPYPKRGIWQKQDASARSQRPSSGRASSPMSSRRTSPINNQPPGLLGGGQQRQLT